jgi:16S rRNA G966 N2-methylase RsmD
MKNRVKLLRIYRGVIYTIEYLIFELPRGLNISPRSKSNRITLQGNHGYALTSFSALKNMLGDIDIRGLSLLDIGSGKGGVIIYSNQLGCLRSAGIEYEPFLHEIAVRNISKLKLNSSCVSYNVDARDFKNYAEYDILFMFNPFVDDIYEQVVKQISFQISSSETVKTRYLVCYGGANIEAINKCGLFSLIREEFCPYRGNLFRVFEVKRCFKNYGL